MSEYACEEIPNAEPTQNGWLSHFLILVYRPWNARGNHTFYDKRGDPLQQIWPNNKLSSPAASPLTPFCTHLIQSFPPFLNKQWFAIVTVCQYGNTIPLSVNWQRLWIWVCFYSSIISTSWMRLSSTFTLYNLTQCQISLSLWSVFMLVCSICCGFLNVFSYGNCWF